MAYLFTHFTNDDHGDKEQVWFAISRDGLNWTDIGSDEPVLSSKIGTTGVRDPFMIYDENLKKYIIIATDLCTTKGGSWDDFSARGSRDLIIWESENLIDWTEERAVTVGIPEAGCVWAPEAIYCKEEGKWFIFFASRVKEDGDADSKQRIYATFTSDFVSFSETFKYIDAETDVIDTNIVWDNGWYYRFSKDETNKVITIERSKTLVPEGNDGFEKIHSDLLSEFFGLEGPECYKLPDGKWCLIADQYHTWKGYTPFLCDDLSTGDFTLPEEDSYNMGKRQKRHGSIIEISDETADKLISHYGIA